jgi:hypothetical protein
LKDELEFLDGESSVNDHLQNLAEVIDQRIHQLCRLWPNNYVAHDLLEGNDRFKSFYRADDVEEFQAYLSSVLRQIGNEAEAREILLRKYAYPIINRESLT